MRKRVLIIAALLLMINDVTALGSEERLRNLEIGQARIETKIDTMTTMLLVVVAAFSGIVATTIGFAIWDRRTMIRPFETKVGTFEDQVLRITEDHENWQRLVWLYASLPLLTRSWRRCCVMQVFYNFCEFICLKY